MTRVVSFVVLLAWTLALPIIATGVPATAGPVSESYRRQILQKRRELLLAMQNESARRITGQMASVTSWLIDYGRKKGHFPGEPSELAEAQERLLSIVPENPYMPVNPFDLSGQSLCEKRLPQSLVVRPVYGMGERDISDFADHLPDDWQADPGTITVLTNGRDIAAVWAAAADRRPLKDAATNKPVLGIARLTSR